MVFLIVLRAGNENMDRLMTRLQLLSLAIGKLNPTFGSHSKGTYFKYVYHNYVNDIKRFMINSFLELR